MRVAAGDEAAFEQLVRLHRPRLLRIAERVVDGGRAEDAVQIALLRAYQSFSGGEVPRQPSAWLSAITRNAAIDQQRRRGPVDPVAEPERGASAPSVASIAESRAELRDVLRDVAALPDHEREALLMRATTGAGHEAIGAELSVSPGQARQLLHRARRRLREVAAILLPAWLALRVSQARAAVTTIAAAPSETVLSTKGAALAIAAAATIGGGGAALQATRPAERQAPPGAASERTQDAVPTGANASARATTGTGTGTAGRQTNSNAAPTRASSSTGDDRRSATDDRSRTGDAPAGADRPTDAATSVSTSNASTSAPSSPGATDDRRPTRGDDHSGSGSSGSGSSGSGRGDDDRATSGSSSNSGSGSGSNSGSGSSGSGRDDAKDDDRETSGSESSSGSTTSEAPKIEDSSGSGKSSSGSGKSSSSSSDSSETEDASRSDDRGSDDAPDERAGRSVDPE